MRPLRQIAGARGSRFLFFLSCCGVTGVGCEPRPRTAAALGNEARAAAVQRDPRAVHLFHSKRFELSIPLHDREGWRIDDHTQKELRGTHAATRSTLTLYTFGMDNLVNRQVCEARARAIGLVDLQPLETVADEVVRMPGEFDSRIWVAVNAARPGGEGLLGHVFAFGGHLRKCLFFHYETQAPTVADEAALSARLAAARVQMFGGITLDAMVDVPRASPSL